MEDFQESWVETWETCRLAAEQVQDFELAEKCQKFKEIDPQEEIDAKEFRETIKRARMAIDLIQVNSDESQAQ